MGKKIISGLFLAIGALLLLALLNLNYLLQRNKAYLLAQAGHALGRQISADLIEATLWPLGARLVNLTVSGDAADANADLLRAKAMLVELQFLPLLTGEFRPRKLVLDTPVLTIMRRDNHAKEGARKKNRSKKARANEAAPETQNPDSRPFFVVAPLKITEGILRVREPNSGRELIVSQINLQIDVADVQEPFTAELGAAVMAEQVNLRLKGRFGPLAGVRDYRDLPIDGSLQVEALNMDQVHSVIPELKKGLPRVLQFDGIYSTKDLRFKGSLNNLSLKGAITGSDASVRFE